MQGQECAFMRGKRKNFKNCQSNDYELSNLFSASVLQLYVYSLLLLITEMTKCLLSIIQSIEKKPSLFRRIYNFWSSSFTSLHMSLHMAGNLQTLTNNFTHEQSQETQCVHSCISVLQKQDPIVLEIHIFCIFIICSVWAIVSCLLWWNSHLFLSGNKLGFAPKSFQMFCFQMLLYAYLSF